MFSNKNIPWGDIGWIVSSVLLWYLTVYPFNGTYTMDDMNMNYFAIIMLFTIVFTHVLSMLEDHRLALLTSLASVLELLIWERMMGFGFGATGILFSMGMIFLVSYKSYPTRTTEI
ncbi:MAG TPA: hypothetical protein PLM93_11460 [Sulfuricurvum sp.]|nr:MAG: hypothetical protein B7Y30_06755 [Campylobacterales bacterium 16-40-21]OZA02200.1 MAG: hypothetical protein B7X89_10220 [Sulfuricurvum sp. 17-40-25]HQS67791.1 hypothetical protein [Sulfuricurvum sp.]HQT36312.1 hypothetical protein [Sulfuricurvum sp.]